MTRSRSNRIDAGSNEKGGLAAAFWFSRRSSCLREADGEFRAFFAVDRVDEADRVRLEGHEERRRAAAAAERDAARGVAVGNAGSAEDDVVARGEIRRVVNLVGVHVAHRGEAFFLP